MKCWVFSIDGAFKLSESNQAFIFPFNTAAKPTTTIWKNLHGSMFGVNQNVRDINQFFCYWLSKYKKKLSILKVINSFWLVSAASLLCPFTNIAYQPSSALRNIRLWLTLFFKDRPFPASFLYFRIFCILIARLVEKILPITGFKLWISGVGSNHSTNWATPMPHVVNSLIKAASLQIERARLNRIVREKFGFFNNTNSNNLIKLQFLFVRCLTDELINRKLNPC